MYETMPYSYAWPVFAIQYMVARPNPEAAHDDDAWELGSFTVTVSLN